MITNPTLFAWLVLVFEGLWLAREYGLSPKLGRMLMTVVWFLTLLALVLPWFR